MCNNSAQQGYAAGARDPHTKNVDWLLRIHFVWFAFRKETRGDGGIQQILFIGALCALGGREVKQGMSIFDNPVRFHKEYSWQRNSRAH